MRDKLGRFVKGFHASPNTEFKKGQNTGDKHHNFKGGRYKMKNGYISVLAPNHPRAYRNRVYEHILVAEEKLGRYLEKGEVVHHINGVKDDNRIENIEILNNNSIHRTKHRQYQRYDKKPKPTFIGDRIYLIPHKKIFECYQCERCGNLFWAFCRYTSKQKYCGHSCGTLGGLYDK